MQKCNTTNRYSHYIFFHVGFSGQLLVIMPPKKRGKVVRRIDKTMSFGPQMQGLRPFKPNLKNIRLTRERIEKLCKFLQQQSTNLGQSIGAILSQVLSNRDVSWRRWTTLFSVFNVTSNFRLMNSINVVISYCPLTSTTTIRWVLFCHRPTRP